MRLAALAPRPGYDVLKLANLAKTIEGGVEPGGYKGAAVFYGKVFYWNKCARAA